MLVKLWVKEKEKKKLKGKEDSTQKEKEKISPSGTSLSQRPTLFRPSSSRRTLAFSSLNPASLRPRRESNINLILASPFSSSPFA